MRDVQALLVQCYELGAELTPTPHGTLKVKSPSPLPEALRNALKQRKAEVIRLLERWTPSPQPGKALSPTGQKDVYRQSAESAAEDCFAIDPHWLIDHHPNVWKRLVWLDERAEEIERVGKSEEDYRNVLDRLVATVKEARRLYVASQDKEGECTTS